MDVNIRDGCLILAADTPEKEYDEFVSWLRSKYFGVRNYVRSPIIPCDMEGCAYCGRRNTIGQISCSGCGARL